jgi:hypothetical protein
MHQCLAFSKPNLAGALDSTLTAAMEPKKISRKGAKNAQQYVTNALPSRFGRFA